MALAELTVLNRKSSGDTSTTLLPDACVVGTCLREHGGSAKLLAAIAE
jgi:hypothetical protein